MEDPCSISLTIFCAYPIFIKQIIGRTLCAYAERKTPRALVAEKLRPLLDGPADANLHGLKGLGWTRYVGRTRRKTSALTARV